MLFDIEPSQICPLVTFRAIFSLKINHFCLYLSEALFYTVRTWYQIKGVDLRTILTLFEVCISFHYKVMIIFVSHEIFCLWDVNY